MQAKPLISAPELLRLFWKYGVVAIWPVWLMALGVVAGLLLIARALRRRR